MRFESISLYRSNHYIDKHVCGCQSWRFRHFLTSVKSEKKLEKTFNLKKVNVEDSCCIHPCIDEFFNLTVHSEKIY